MTKPDGSQVDRSIHMMLKVNNLLRALKVSNENRSLEERMVRIMSLTMSISLLAVVIGNALLELPIWVNILVGLNCVFYFGIYLYSRSNDVSEKLKLIFWGVAFITLMPLWFLNGGLKGTLFPYFFLMLIVGTVIFQVKHLVYVMLAVGVNLLLLITLEKLFPNLVVDYETELQYEADLYLSIFVSYVCICLVLLIYRVTYSKDHQKLNFVKQNLDLTNKNLHEAKVEAEKASNAKSDFLAQMSHELRTPLSTITGTSDMLKNTNLDQEQKELVSLMNESSSVLLNIISDILDLSKVEAHKLEIDELPTDVSEAFKSTINSLQFKVDQSKKELVLKTEIDPLLPKYQLIDEVRFKQIITNLVSNAIKYTNKGEIILRAFEQSLDGNEVMVVEVEDTGIGIEEDLIDDIMQPFYQVDSKARNELAGVGLGLAICKNLLRLMGGGLSVKSQVGVGSVFSFYVPLKEVSAHLVKKEMLPIPSEDEILSELNLLLVEDNLINQTVLCKMLEGIGLNPLVANNGKEAVEMVKEHEVDVILMDVFMPVMDGIAATKAILADDEIFFKPFIIALTANALKEDEKRCRDAGMDDFVSKPVTSDKLRERLRYALGELSNR